VKWIEKARFLATQARDQAPHYQHSSIGYNYRLSNICAGIGRGQLSVLNDRIANRRANFEFYKDALKSHSEFTFVDEPEGYFSNRWLTTILIQIPDNQNINRESLRLNLNLENIESRPLWKPMHLQPVFSNCPAYVTGVSEKLFNLGLCLPSGSNLQSVDLERVVKVLEKFPVTMAKAGI
jgi:dTDP-4-amino-4,6-dideoxygalactose transaminase